MCDRKIDFCRLNEVTASLYDAIIFTWSNFLCNLSLRGVASISRTMPLFNKKKYQPIRSDYVPLPGTKETLSPSFPDIRYILLCVFIEDWR